MPFKQLAHLGGVLAGQDRRAGDLGTVEVQHGKHRTVVLRVEKADAFPAALERPRLRLTVAHHGHCKQIRVVHDSAEGMDEDVAELAAFVDRAGSSDGHVRRDPTR